MDMKRIAFAGGTFACAIGIGFFMQQGQAAVPEAEQTLDVAVKPIDAPIKTQTLVAPQTASLIPTLAPITNVQSTASQAGSASTSDEDGGATRRVTELAETSPDAAPTRPVGDEVAGAVCDVAMTGADARAAMVEVTLTAPCAVDQIATIHHEGMMFSVELDSTGQAKFEMPVLNENALIIAALEGGEGAVLTHQVPTLATYDRVVVQWKGNIGVELHAREWGADYGEAGHVWHGAARDAGAVSYQVGFLTRLGAVGGDTPLVADVYTFPTEMTEDEGSIQMSVETEINMVNCAKDITAQTIQISPYAERIVHDLELALPDCDAVGDFVLLPMPVEDIKLASR